MKALNEIPINVRAVGITMTLAALVIALLAVAINVTSAQADGIVVVGPIEPRTGSNEEEYDEPYPCSEEAQPDAETAKVIREGYYAVFDAFWDYEVGHLSDNFCPPEVTATTTYDPATQGTKTVITREDAHIHISETAFSIPDSYKVTVVDSEATNGNPATATEPKIDLADYPFLRQAVSAVETQEDGTTVFAGNSVWWVRLDEPGTTADETSDLKIGFSTDLMEEADWFKDLNEDGVSDGPPVQFHFGAVHVLEAGVPQEVHVVGADFFAFEQRATDTPLEKAKWSNLDTAADSEINMATGQYKPMQFIFTKPGEYLVQGQIQGHIRTFANRLAGADPDWKPISPGVSLTSPTEWYTFHVGPVADVGVTLTHTDETPNDDATTVTDGTASFSVTATNSGPATSTNVVVEVSLPVGLDYVTPNPKPANVDYACGVISWKVGDLTSSGASSSSTLNFTANVGAGAPKSLTVDAEVHSSTVDENDENDTASVDVMSTSTVVRPPFFPGVTRSIPENAVAGSHAGDPVAANNPDGRGLSYTLSGRCSSWFQVHSNGQIVLAAGPTLDIDEQSAFHLTLDVSDGVNSSSTADASADDSTPVTIRVIGTPDGVVHPAVTFSVRNPYPDDQPNLDLSGTPPLSLPVGTDVDIVPIFSNPPSGLVSYHWVVSGAGEREHLNFTGAANGGGRITVSADRVGSGTYTMHATWNGGGITATYTINWVSAS